MPSSGVMRNSYRLSGRVTAENRTPWGQQVYCSVHAGENGASVDEVSGPLPNDDYQFGPNTFIAPFDGIVELDAPGSLWASCHGREVQGENASYPWATVQLTATTLTNVTVDPPGLMNGSTAFPNGQGTAHVYP